MLNFININIINKIYLNIFEIINLFYFIFFNAKNALLECIINYI